MPHVCFPSAAASSTETAQGTLCTPTKRPRDSGTVASSSCRRLCSANPVTHTRLCFAASGSESEATPEKRPRTDEKDGGGEEPRGTPKQKNRRRCYRCQTKLELVQQELGSCRCGQYRHTGHMAPALKLLFPRGGGKCVRLQNGPKCFS